MPRAWAAILISGLVAACSDDSADPKFGFTGRERFCLAEASLDDLAQRSVEDLQKLQGHYEFCADDVRAGQLVLDERVRRGDAGAEFEQARRLAMATSDQNPRVLELLKSAAAKGHVEAKAALERLRSGQTL